MKNNLVWVIVAVIVLFLLVLGYMGRHQIKVMLGMTPTQSTETQVVATPEATSVPTVVSPSPSTASAIIMTKTDSVKGDYLTDSKGMTLYLYDKDKVGVSNCSGACATNWPPFIASSAASTTMPANITTIKRSDDTMQYAYKGIPLYYYVKDTKVGDMIGDGVGGVWHLVKS